MGPSPSCPGEVRLKNTYDVGSRHLGKQWTQLKQVAHVLWRSEGGIRRHVRTIAAHPPDGWQTAAVFGPSDLASYFTGLPFRPVTLRGLLSARAGFDVVHAHGITAGTVALLPGGPPVVLSIHVVLGATGATARSPMARRGALAIASRADAVIAPTQRAAIGFERARIIPPAFCPLAPPSRSRDDVRRELGASEDDVVALAVSRLQPEKRLDLFVRAVESSGCVGWLVGDGPERLSLEASASGTRTRWLGSREDIADLLAAADVFVSASSSESYGIAVGEAIHAGLPVVASRTGAIEEIVGAAGVVVAPGDDDAFIEALVTMVADGEERMRRSAIARAISQPGAHSGAQPDAATLIGRIGAVYDEVSTKVVS